MSMVELNFNYDSDDTKWKNKFEQYLIGQGIKYNNELLDSFVNSIYAATYRYLVKCGYRPSNSLTYRRNLVSRLYRDGYIIVITTNDILDLYLKTFIDLDDFSNAINVYIKKYDIMSKKNKDNDIIIKLNGLYKKVETSSCDLDTKFLFVDLINLLKEVY